jgi:Zn-dependent protease with chaperone function
VLAVLLVCAVALYHYGVPFAARTAAAQIPAGALDAVSRDAVAALDRGTFEPSRLPPEREDRLTRAFTALVGRQKGERYTLLFRRSPSLGPNAMALPSGTIVITDELVTLARDDRELLGVLAHEAGHVEGRHGVRLILQNSALTLLAAWMVGDVTSLMTLAPTTLLQARYSRDFEREADAYAADLLRAHGISPGRLADLLERMEAGQPGSSSVVAYVSSHPATPERLAFLRAR